jgi:hypothetical protein
VSAGCQLEKERGKRKTVMRIIKRTEIRVDKSTQAVKRVCQTLLHAKVRTGIPHKKNDDDRTELPIIQLKSCKKYIADPCVCVCPRYLLKYAYRVS